jgi:hypothetical protein
MTIEIQRADPAMRTFTAIVLGAATVVAIIVVYAFQRWLARATAGVPNPELIAQLRLWVAVTTTAIGTCLLVLAAYSARLARMTIGEKRWPPQSMRVIRDTPVRRDANALAIGRALNTAALLLVLFGVAAAIFSWRSFNATG